uniref:Uncharacterized protein n=1 Tax=Panagrolaimus superbus TaxID=310955 RepID=A0A914YT30_9BILA
MFARSVSNASFVALKTVQRQNQFRLLNASAVALRDKNVMDQAKEGAQNLVEKAKETIQHAKDQVGANNIVNKANEAMEHAKEKVQNMANNVNQKGVSGAASEAFQQVKDTVTDAKNSVMGDGSGTTPAAKGKSSTYDPRGSQKHVEEIIQVNKDHFKVIDKKLGGTGESKAGFDPKTL